MSDISTIGRAVELEGGAFIPPFATNVSLDLPSYLPFAEWEKVARRLQQAHRSILWWVGDCLLYGERHYGEDYAQAYLERLGYTQSVLENARWVASRYPLSTRVEPLSWTHYREAASLPDGERADVLREANERNWSSRELHEEVARRKDRALPTDASRPAADISRDIERWLAEGERLAAAVGGGAVFVALPSGGTIDAVADLLAVVDPRRRERVAVDDRAFAEANL